MHKSVSEYGSRISIKEYNHLPAPYFPNSFFYFVLAHIKIYILLIPLEYFQI